jgi:predicted glycosyltransferase
MSEENMVTSGEMKEVESLISDLKEVPKSITTHQMQILHQHIQEYFDAFLLTGFTIFNGEPKSMSAISSIKDKMALVGLLEACINKLRMEIISGQNGPDKLFNKK